MGELLRRHGPALAALALIAGALVADRGGWWHRG
jgi:hypothetical protein